MVFSKLDLPLSSEVIQVSFKSIGQNENIINNNYIEQDYLPLYYSMKNTGDKPIIPHIVLNDKDLSSNKAIIKTIFSDVNINKLTDEEKVIKILNYIYEYSNWEFPPYYSKTEFSYPVNFLNSLGYGFCSDLSSSIVLLAETIGLDSRVTYLNGDHVVAEIFYDNGWHMFDASVGVYFRSSSGEVASVNSILEDSFLINQISESFDRQKDQKDFMFRVFPNIKDDLDFEISYDYINNFNEKMIKNDFLVELDPGEEIRYYYNWKGHYFWKDFNSEPTRYSNGLLMTDLEYVDLSDGDYQVVKIDNPHPILSAYLLSYSLCEFSSDISFSIDGINWNLVGDSCQDGFIEISEDFFVGYEDKVIHSYFIKLPKRLHKTKIYTQFQVSPNSIPLLKDGYNSIVNLDDNNVKVYFSFIKK